MAQKVSTEPKPSTTKLTESKESVSTSEITMKQFLDFLRTAYQVSESVEETLSSVDGMTEVVDWIKLKNNELVKPKSVTCQTSSTDVGDGSKDLEHTESLLRAKLDEVLSEGILDSVLPYLVPSNTGKKTSQSKLDKSGSSTSNTKANSSKESIVRRKSNDLTSSKTAIKTDSEVEIHVCDEVKNVKKDFLCSQKLLVEKMGYFAEVTSGQKLEDMDISVHCDVSIFEWLMRWVKKDLIPEEDWPKLDSQCVVPILVSAAFLQMEPLLQDCLFYCHANMNEILQIATNLNCLNDSIITRLAAMYTNSELEQIKDKRDKIQSRLYCKLIISLCESTCESVRGHWDSLAYIFRCTRCEQLVMPDVAETLPCRPNCMSLDRHGEVISHHVRDTNWNINEYISSLQSQLKTWRKVYWRLWGDCHFLTCSVCDKPFPVHRMKWCCYHPEPPQFFTVDSQKSPLPIGRFPCCGERSYRFQLLENYSGCQFREHVPVTVKARDAAVGAILESFRDVIDTEPPELIFPERLTRLVARDSVTDARHGPKEVFWWDGLQITPPRQQLGILGAFTNTPYIRDTQSFEEIPEFSSDDLSSSESCSGSSQSEESHHAPQKCAKPRKSPKKKTVGRLWQLNLSARSNQDLQRANEEAMLARMINYLSKKVSIEGASKHKGWLRHVVPPGGIYMRLEAEWKEANLMTGSLKRFNNKPKIRATKIS